MNRISEYGDCVAAICRSDRCARLSAPHDKYTLSYSSLLYRGHTGTTAYQVLRIAGDSRDGRSPRAQHLACLYNVGRALDRLAHDARPLREDMLHAMRHLERAHA